MRKSVFLLMALLMVSVVLNVIWWPGGHDVKVERSEKVEVKKEVSRDTMPVASAEKPLEIVVVSMRQSKDEMVSEPPLTVEVMDSDTLVSVPITQRVYEDSNYVAYVSGYRAKLDSIMVVNTLRTRTIREVIKEEKPPNRITIGLIGGYGYGFSDKKVQPFIGIGVSVRLF